MKRNEEITTLANEILLDISNNRSPLHVALLKASRLSSLLDIPGNVTLFKDWAKNAEAMEFSVGSFQSKMEASKDPNISYAGGNQYYIPHGNFLERMGIRKETEDKAKLIASYRAETYNFVSDIYTRWQFGNMAESIFDKKRRRVEPVFPEIVPDIQSRLNSIEQNLRSDNPEDWKNAVSSCRALIMDVANKLSPPTTSEEKGKYISRLQTYLSPLASKTKKALLRTLLDEIKLRIEYTMDLTQGGSHSDRPLKEKAEDVVLYTYLLLSEIAEVHKSKAVQNDTPEKNTLKANEEPTPDTNRG